MARFLVLPGSVAVASDRLVQILGLNVDGSIEARDLANGSTFNCDPSLLKAAPRARHGQAGAAQRIDVAVDNDWETARQREAVLRTISEQGNLSRQVADAAANLGVSVRTVFRWLAAYRQLPQTSSLLPNPMGPPKGTKRIDAKVEEVIESVINDVYLSKPRAKKEEVARMVGLRCEAMGLKAPSRKPILARLSALDKSVVAKARLEPGEAAALVDFVPGTYKVVKPLDVVQIDHTLADVIVVDEENRLPIGRPWLTLAVDVATRVIVGFYVSLEAPSSTSVALCIAQAVLPKEQWLRQRELNCVWPVWGLPKAVHADNGADFTAAALRRGCDEHGIKLILRPIANPHYGGHIERLIGTIMGRVHLLPGSTGSNPQDKGQYPAEAQARLTMAELEQWLALEICEQYHRRIHKGIRKSPLAAWELGVHGQDPIVRSLPEQPEQFTVSFLPFEERRLRRDGLHMFHIRYWDNVLPVLVKPGVPILVRFDPRNLSRVWVMGPDNNYHPIRYADLSLPPITLWEHRAAIQTLKEQGKTSLSERVIFQAVLAQRELIEKASAKTKSARRLAQRQRNAQSATLDQVRQTPGTIDYSKPVEPYDAEIWE